MILPNLIVIGAMKCGTTSLHEYLDRHSDIGMSARKELDFFSGANANLGIEWYQKHFDINKAIRGESSQNYSKAHDPFHSGAPDRMAEFVPKAKLIYVVRDPIERYRSHIVENYLGETDDIRRHNMKIDTYVRTGLYHWQLSFFLKFYPLQQILVVDADDLRCDRLATMNRIFDFLGVPLIDNPAIFAFEANNNGEDVVPQRIRGSFPYRALHRIAPQLLRLAETAPVVRRTLFSGSFKAQLAENDRQKLVERFAPDVAALRALTGQSFSRWQM